jgi:hypothetical protein
MMRAFDLEAELWSAVNAVQQPHLNRLVDLGVPKWALARLGAVQPPFGVHKVHETPDGFYEPVEDGSLNIIMPVYECGDVIDLIALRPSEPTRWRWRTGDGWALGLDLLAADPPIDLVANPLAWLAEAGSAFCLLDWTLPPQKWARLRTGPPIVTDDDLLRHRLNKSFAAAVPPLIGNRPNYHRKGKSHAA